MNKETLMTVVKVQKNAIIVGSLAFGTVLIIAVSTIVSLMEPTVTVTCQNVGSFKDAQDALKLHPELDKNKDGIACNQLQ